jgi:hypothetical protein
VQYQQDELHPFKFDRLYVMFESQKVIIFSCFAFTLKLLIIVG